MADQVEIIESCFDTFTLERAFLDRAGQPRAFVSGVLCNLDTKPHLLEIGLAFCQPVDQRSSENWPVFTDVICNGVQDRWWNITNNLEAVQAAQRLALLVRGDPLACQELADQYEARFGNSDEIAHPSVMGDPRFLALLQEALDTDRRLTRSQVEARFGPVAWEW